MLKVNTDGSITVKLIGNTPADKVFGLAVVLVLGAIVVALMAAMLPSRYAIGGVFVLACGCFYFNRLRERAKTHQVIACGNLTVGAYQLQHQGQLISLSNTASIEILNDTLCICDKGKTYHVTGFETAQEMTVAQAVLLGGAVQGRMATIKMNEA